MRRIFGFLLMLTMVFGIAVPCYATRTLVDEEYETVNVDVYARYVSTMVNDTVPVVNGSAEITADNGYIISVTGAPSEATILRVVPIPSGEKAAWSWFSDCIDCDVSFLSIYDIYFEDVDGNRINVNKVDITITNVNDVTTVFSVETTGIATELNFDILDESIYFTADGSHYYVLIKELRHTEVTDKAVAATCTTAGKTEGKHCSVCNKVLVAQEEIKALGHTWKVESTANGIITYVCTTCGEKKEEKDPNAQKPQFEDVKADAYYADAVQWAVENGITNGYGSETTFCPDIECTRGQVVTFLWRAAGSPEPVSLNNPFTDVASNAYYYKAVLWAVENGITAGYGSDTIFNPDGVCNRAQVATFMWRSAGKPGMSGVNNRFTDVARGAYYYDAVLWAVENGITNGYGSDTIFNPDGNCTRGQIVTFLYRGIK